jgi:hypothetical protein
MTEFTNFTVWHREAAQLRREAMARAAQPATAMPVATMPVATTPAHSSGPDFVELARAHAELHGTTLRQAMSKLARERPHLYAAYVSAAGRGPLAGDEAEDASAQGGGEDFFAKARRMQAEDPRFKGSYREAAKALARSEPELHAAYVAAQRARLGKPTPRR